MKRMIQLACLIILVSFSIGLGGCSSKIPTNPENVGQRTTTTSTINVTANGQSNVPAYTSPYGEPVPSLDYIKTYLEISPSIVKLNEPTTLSVTIVSQMNYYNSGLKAVIIFPGDSTLYSVLDGSGVVPITIEADKPIHFSMIVAFKKVGDWSLSACVEELVIRGSGPMGMYYRSPSGTSSLKVVAE